MDSAEILPGVRVFSDRCLIMEEGRVMVIGDLHLGYERALEEEGFYLPRINTETIRGALNRAICRHEPSTVILLGDIKHDFRRTRYEAREEILSLIRMLRAAAEVVVVKGNHDNFIQNVLSEEGILAVDHVDAGGFRLEHGHTDSGRRPVIIGHEHPSVRIKDPLSGGIKMACFLHLKEDGIIVLPPFSLLSSGTDLVSSDPESFMSPACRNADTDSAEVYGVSEIGVIPLGKLGEISGLEL